MDVLFLDFSSEFETISQGDYRGGGNNMNKLLAEFIEQSYAGFLLKDECSQE